MVHLNFPIKGELDSHLVAKLRTRVLSLRECEAIVFHKRESSTVKDSDSLRVGIRARLVENNAGPEKVLKFVLGTMELDAFVYVDPTTSEFLYFCQG